jgi:hypothetical protein
VGLLSSIFLTFIPSPSYATDLEQAVVVALGTANTEVTQSETASAAVAPLVTIATQEANQAIQAASSLSNQVTNATSAVGEVDAAIITVTNATGIDQSSLTIIEAKDTVVDAQTAINAISTIIAQSELAEATTARTNVTTAMTTAATQFSEANQSISNAQDAINNLQATIATVRDVLQGVDDAGIQMILPFSMQMGNTIYNAIYVGSNATLTFGVNEGANFYSTPNAPSVSVGGLDWTTWSYGTGITYATTAGTLDIAWDVRVFPTTDASIQLTQLRFNADINPNTGAWTATVSGIGPHVDNARWNYRESTGGTVISIIDTDTDGANEFQGSLSQGNYTAPTNLPDNSGIQAVVDSANAQLAALNQRISAVVVINSQNQQLVNAIPSTTSVQTAINNTNISKTNLQNSLNQKSTTLTNAINTYIPTPAPILSTPVVNGSTVTLSASLPEGYTANTWFYQVIADDPNAENPYAGGTYNTDGAPESIQLTGLTEGATYIIRIANWSGPVSQYTETTVSIPSTQSSNLIGGGSINIELPEQNPPTDPNPVEPDPVEPPVDPEPQDPTDPSGETPSEGGESPGTDTPGSDEPSSNDGQDNNPEENQNTDNSQDNDTLSVEEIQEAVGELIQDGNITAADAETIIDALSADGEITTDEVVNLSEVLSEDGVLTLAEKDLVADALVKSADGAPVEASDITAAGLEYRDLPPLIPVEVREDANGNPVVITAEVASALLTLEDPAAFIGGIATCINPDEELEGLTEEEKCEILKALANIGADMSPQERQKAKEVLVAAVLVGQVIVGSALIRRN